MKLTGKLPTGDINGLPAIEQAMIAAPEDGHLVVAVVDTEEVRTKTDTEESEPTVRVRKVEALHGDDAVLARQLLDRAHDARVGHAPLPYADAATGEVM